MDDFEKNVPSSACRAVIMKKKILHCCKKEKKCCKAISLLKFITWLVFVADITRALIG